MWKTRIIKHTNSDGLADRVSAVINKLQDSPEVTGTISLNYAVCPIVESKLLPGFANNSGKETMSFPGIEYSCMITYRTIKSFDTLADEKSNP